MPLSPRAIAAVLSPDTPNIFLELVTITPPTGEPLRLVRNAESVVSRGHTYEPAGFEIRLPDSADNLPKVRITVDNVDRALTTYARSNSDLGTLRFEVVLAASPNIVEFGPLEFRLLQWDLSVAQVEFELGFEDLLNRRLARRAMTPSEFPAMFMGGYITLERAA